VAPDWADTIAEREAAGKALLAMGFQSASSTRAAGLFQSKSPE